MKLILAIIQDKDSGRLSKEFVDANIRATKLSTTGGFLKAGNTTFLIGIEDERVNEVLALIQKIGKAREEYVAAPVSLNLSSDGNLSRPIEIQVGGATVFVLPVEGFYQF